MGSVKDLIILKEPSKTPGIGRFVFSDRYSVFDYGVMPDMIDGKGKALCMLSAYFFERLEEEGIKTHYLGVVERGKVRRIDEIEEASNVMEIKLVRVVKPERRDGYDYSIFKTLKNNFLIPLEIIYRNSLPAGSSVFRRIKKGEISLEDLKLKEIPKPGERLKEPIIDFSTKLESEDRYLRINEAKEISGLSDEEMDELIRIALKVNEIINRETEKVGIVNEDGKIELAFDEKREFMVVDALGNPDECRFSFNGVEISKEVLRGYYRRTEWYKKIEEIKGKKEWRKIVGSPPKLPPELIRIVSQMYMACCNEITSIKFFEVPKLRDVIKELAQIISLER